MRGSPIVILILALLTAACGGSGTPASPSTPAADPPTPPAASSSVLWYPGPQVFTVDVPAVSVSPSLNDPSGNSFSISPPLPAGLTIDADTGAISGTPAAVTPAASYTISLVNAADGPAQASILIEINNGPFFYSSPIIVAAGSAMTPVAPRGGTGSAQYSVTPQLPSGLTIDPATGVISGTPTTVQPPAYYQVSRAEVLLTLKFGLTLGVGAESAGPIAVSNVSTPSCAYSGGFIGSYTGSSQANDEGLIAIAFTPDGNARARVLDLSDYAVYNSDGLPGLSANLDGSFDINLPGPTGTPAREIRGNFSGADLIMGTYESGGIARPFIASRLGGSSSADFRYTGGFGSSGSYPVDFGVLDITGTKADGIGYELVAFGGDYLLLNRQWAIQGTFQYNTFSWFIPDEDTQGSSIQSNTGLQFSYGDIYDGYYAETLGCRLN